MELPEIPRDNIIEPKRICIIGGGSAGLAALKIIKDTPQFKSGAWIPVAFEARDRVGGIWLPAPPTDNPPLTPLYDSLTTNLPHPVMCYTSFSFPPETPVFPPAEVVQKYLESYSDHFDLNPYVQLGISVDVVERTESQWKVKLSNGDTQLFDLVAVCNGHYRVPRYPEIPGVSKWLESGRAIHSSWYRNPDSVTEKQRKKILVVGAGPSGLDISSELSPYADTLVHSVSGSPPLEMGNVKRRGRILELRDNGEVLFEDGLFEDRLIESDISLCILATGYETSVPFLTESVLRNSIPPPVPPIPQGLYNSSYNVFPLAKHMFPLGYEDHSIAFLGLLVRVAPFPLLEAQARVMVHVFAHPHTLDSTQEAVDIITRYTELSAECGSDNPLTIARAWHRFKNHEQFHYRDQLYEFADASTSGLEGIEGRVVVPAWEKKMYDEKAVLRKFWVHLEKEGLAAEWVKGVGEGGPHEWVELLERMLSEANKAAFYGRCYRFG